MASIGTRIRTTRVAHTDKPPERCPYCDSTHVTRKGMRKKKIEIVQLWRCASCKRVFTPSPAVLCNRTYPFLPSAGCLIHASERISGSGL
jgi:ribosomal protein L37AE/L43A